MLLPAASAPPLGAAGPAVLNAHQVWGACLPTCPTRLSLPYCPVRQGAPTLCLLPQPGQRPSAWHPHTPSTACRCRLLLWCPSRSPAPLDAAPSSPLPPCRPTIPPKLHTLAPVLLLPAYSPRISYVSTVRTGWFRQAVPLGQRMTLRRTCRAKESGSTSSSAHVGPVLQAVHHRQVRINFFQP
jgi:hypothetical protein